MAGPNFLSELGSWGAKAASETLVTSRLDAGNNQDRQIIHLYFKSYPFAISTWDIAENVHSSVALLGRPLVYSACFNKQAPTPYHKKKSLLKNPACTE